MAERVQGFEERGYRMVQSGDWKGGNLFAFFEAEGEGGGVWFETIVFGEGGMGEAEGVWPVEGEEGEKEGGG